MSEEELQKLLEAANSVLQKGDKAKALSLYEEIVIKDPNNAEAHMRLAELYAEKGLKEKALTELLLLGNAYYESRLFKNALKYFQKVLELDSLQIEVRVKAAEIYVNEDMEREAKLEYLAIAEHFLSANELNRAEEYAKKAIELKSLEAHYIMGLIYFNRGMFREAAVSLEILTKIKVNHVGALLHLGHSHVNSGKFAEAAAVFERVLKAEPDSIEALKGLTDSFVRKGSAAEATGIYIQAIDAMLKARVLSDAIEFGLEFVKGSPTNPEGHVKLAQVYEAKSMTKEAAAAYKLAGNYYLKQKAATKSKEALDKAALLEKITSVVPPAPAPAVQKEAVTKAPPAGFGQKEAGKAKEIIIERTSVFPKQQIKAKTDPLIQSFINDTADKSTIEIKETAEFSAIPKTEAKEETGPLQEIKGEIDELFALSDKHMKDGFYEKAIELYRVILKKESRNSIVRQKLHQAYLLLAQQEEEIVVANEDVKKISSKEKKNKISYL
jgi:tetratricopeptide (TPR) repeat protein